MRSMDGPHEYPALGAPGVARAGVLRARVYAALSTGGDSRPVERVASPLVSALSRRRRNIGGRGTDAPGCYAHSAVARLLCGRWRDYCDGFWPFFLPHAGCRVF